MVFFNFKSSYMSLFTSLEYLCYGSSAIIILFYSYSVGAGPDGSFVSTGACNLEVPGSNPGPAEYLSSWLCIYSAPVVICT